MKRIQSRYRALMALELAAKGMTYDEIATELGYADRSGAWRAVQSILARREAEVVEEYRYFAISDLNAVHAKVWPKAMAGNVRAAESVLRAVEGRIRLYGL